MVFSHWADLPGVKTHDIAHVKVSKVNFVPITKICLFINDRFGPIEN